MTRRAPTQLESLLNAAPSEATGRALLEWVQSLYGRIERGDMMIGILSIAEVKRAPAALHRAVECGISEAWLELGSWLAAPPFGEPKYREAERALRSAVAMQLPGAKLRLVELWWFYQREEASASQRREAIQILTALLRETPNDSRALYILGLLTCHGFGTKANPTAAFGLQQRAAELGDADAQFELYIHFATGLGVTANADAAFEAISKAAQLGHPRALYNMGAFHATGRHVPKDLRRAAEWYEKAFDAGNPQAALTLAVMYARGEGVEKNIEYAQQLFGQAEWLGLDVSEARDAVGLSKP